MNETRDPDRRSVSCKQNRLLWPYRDRLWRDRFFNFCLLIVNCRAILPTMDVEKTPSLVVALWLLSFRYASRIAAPSATVSTGETRPHQKAAYRALFFSALKCLLTSYQVSAELPGQEGLVLQFISLTRIFCLRLKHTTDFKTTEEPLVKAASLGLNLYNVYKV